MKNEGDDIRRYREGTLTDGERHALEKKALSDPFLADALEGTESITAEELRADLAELSSAIKPVEKKLLFTPLRIAAGVAVVIGASLFYFYPTGEAPELALQEKNTPTAGDSSLALQDTAQLLTLAKPEEVAGGAASTQPSARLDKAGKSSVETKKPDLEPSATAAGPQTELSTSDEAKLAKAETADVQRAEEKEASKVEENKAAVPETVQTLAATEGATDDGERKKSARRAAVSSSGAAAKAKDDMVSGRTISGKVTSSEDGVPLPGVNVVIRGTAQGTVTDINGRYTLALPADNASLVFSFIGLQTNEVETGSRDVVDVQLGEDVSQLSEIVVTGYSGSGLEDDREPVVKMAAPAGGLRAYNKYLETNLHYPADALEHQVKGKVTIQFTVETSGQLSGFSVLKGIGYGCDEEVIRLVKEGPRWRPTTKDDVPLESEVRVKMKFDPKKSGAK